MTIRSAPQRRSHALWFGLVACAVFGLAVPGSAGADPLRSAANAADDEALRVPNTADGEREAAVVSAAVGGAAGDLAMGSSVKEGQAVATGAAENLALVLEDDALLELCARSVVTLQRHAVRKAQIVKLDAGEARFVVSPRSPNQRIEVHTPSAIATILGTVVMMKVDPDTGETTVTSEENAVEVRSSDPSIPGRTKVTEGEQCIVRAGDAPTDARKLPREAFATLGDCLMDLENAALENERIARRKRDLERIAMIDSGDVELPLVGTPGDVTPGIGTGMPNPADPDGIIDPITDRTLPPISGIPPPPPCRVGCLPGSGPPANPGP